MFKTAVVICSLNYLIVLEVKCLPGNGSNFILRFMTCAVNISSRAVVSCEAKKKQQACTYSGLRGHYSELFTRMIGLNF